MEDYLGGQASFNTFLASMKESVPGRSKVKDLQVDERLYGRHVDGAPIYGRLRPTVTKSKMNDGSIMRAKARLCTVPVSAVIPPIARKVRYAPVLTVTHHVDHRLRKSLQKVSCSREVYECLFSLSVSQDELSD